MKLVFAILLALAWATPSPAQHAHGHKGPNGGQMEDVAGVHLELLASGQNLTLNVFDESNKAVPTTGFTASALISSGSDRETLSLAPSGTNSLSGQTKKPINAGATISVTLKTAAGKTGQARFKK